MYTQCFSRTSSSNRTEAQAALERAFSTCRTRTDPREFHQEERDGALQLELWPNPPPCL